MSGLKLLTILLLVGTTCVLAVSNQKEIVKISPDIDDGDFEIKVVQNGLVTTVTFKNEDSETVNEVLNGKGYEVEKPDGSNECLLRRLDESEDSKKKCSVKTPLPSDQVSNDIADFCENRTLYEVQQVPCSNKNANRKKRGCRFSCWFCGGICCGVSCSWGW